MQNMGRGIMFKTKNCGSNLYFRKGLGVIVLILLLLPNLVLINNFLVEMRFGNGSIDNAPNYTNINAFSDNNFKDDNNRNTYSYNPNYKADNNNTYSYQDSVNAGHSLKSSDVAGSDMYSEQLSAFIAGRHSLIKQSFVTNDTNIFQNFDYNDPAFLECSVVIAASNGITPEIYPDPLADELFGISGALTYNALFGFLYYNSSYSSNITFIERSQRAIDIIQETFNIKLFMLDNQNSSYFYPFIGIYPNWNTMLYILTNNIPMDGYWKALNKDRLTSNDYLNAHHISSILMMLDSPLLLSNGVNITHDYFNWDINDINYPFLHALDLTNIFNSLISLLGATSTGNNSSSSSSSSDYLSLLGGLSISSFLEGNNKFLSLVLEYEGDDNKAFESTGENTYKFDLFKALDYDVQTQGQLAPSQKIFIQPLGAFLTELDCSILSGKVIEYYPTELNFSDYLIKQIETIMFLMGQNFNATLIENYSMGILWQSNGSLTQTAITLQDSKQPQNPINLLKITSTPWIALLPMGLVNPIDDFWVQYIVNNSEPLLQIHKEFELTSLEEGTYNLNISVKNVGNETAWGLDLGGTMFDVSMIPIPGWVNTFISLLYPNEDPNKVLGLDQNPRFFLVDSYGNGIYDKYYPDINNPNALTLYSPQLASDIMDPANDPLFASLGINYQTRQNFANSLTNPQSVMNPANWQLAPGESFNYSLNGLSFLNQYRFTDFYTFNYSITPGVLEPYVQYGYEVGGTNRSYGQQFDSYYWKLHSIDISDKNLLQVYFTFRNNSIIEFNASHIDRVHLKSDFKTNLIGNANQIFNNFSIEFYNYSAGDYGEFQAVPTRYLTITNTSIDFNAYISPLDYFNEDLNYTSVFKITIETPQPLEWDINCINLTIADRNITQIKLNSAIVSYSNFAGINKYSIKSSDNLFTTDYAPMIQTKISMDKNYGTPGEIRKFMLNLTNTGQISAANINITLPIPGKIYDPGNFTLVNNSLMFHISNMATATSMNNLYFKFYLPNSELISNIYIEYDSQNKIYQNKSDYNIKLSQIFVSAPVNYNWNGKKPYLDVIKLNYTSDFPNADKPSGKAPEVDDNISVVLDVYNIGTTNINNLYIALPKYVPGLNVTSGDILYLSSLDSGLKGTLNFQLKKTDWQGYYLPGIFLISGNTSRTLRFANNRPLILGYINISIYKTFSDYDIERNNIVRVTINITNSGNLMIKNVTISDIEGFPAEGFDLINGTINFLIPQLRPGDSINYTYCLIAKKQGSFEINAASAKYYYLYKNIYMGNGFTIKIRNNWLQNGFYLLGPAIGGIILTILLYWWKHRYDIEAAEFDRREEIMFGEDYRTFSWDKFIIEEHLEELTRTGKVSLERKKEEVY
ncbi:MAG: BatD family protein [Promethearchaeota archaeon]